MAYSPAHTTHLIKEKARELGFMSCGISRAEELTKEAKDLEKWLSKGYHGSMTWMENHFDKRIDPTKLVEGSKSVISLLLNYFPEKEMTGNLKFSKYAYGRDYHKVIKKKMKTLIGWIREEIGDVEGRAFVDSAPVLDKAWAARGGLGWVGKNTNLISTKTGSFFFIAELICDLELQYDHPATDHCGTCTRCLDACPTDALVAPYQIDGSKCISYYTIELKEAIPEDVRGKFNNWVYGCDICQDVCPWNRFSTPHTEPDFAPKQAFSDLSESDLIEITEDVFEKVFQGSAVKRTKLDGLKRNINFVKGG